MRGILARSRSLRNPCTASSRLPRHMSAEIIDGKAIAEEVRGEVAAAVAEWVAAGHDAPGLATVLVGEDPASAVYVGGKQKATHEVGMQGFDHRLAADTPQADVEALLGELNADPRVSGILLQLPTPAHIDGNGLTWLIDPAKDVDGLTPVSAGLLAKGRPGLRPCTPGGLHGAARPPRRRARGRRGGRRRPLGPRRQAGRPDAARPQRDRDRLPLAHARPAGGLPPRRRPRRRRRPAADGPGRLDQAGRHGARRGHQPHRRRPRRRRRLRRRGRARRADHARAPRRRPDDDRDAAAQHARGGEGERRRSRPRWRGRRPDRA